MKTDKTIYPEYTKDNEIHDLKNIISSLETKIEKLEKQFAISDVISSKTATWENILEHYSDYNSGREITPRELDFYEWVKEKYFPPIKK